MDKLYIGILILLVALQTIMAIGILGDFKTPRLFAIKKIMDIIVYILIYLMVATVYSLPISCTKYHYSYMEIILLGIITLMLGLFELFFSSKTVSIVKNNRIKYPNTGYLLMIISIVTGLFLSFAEIYFALYMLNDGWFIIDEAIKADGFRTAFEFVYYTFSVTITYSGSGIEIVGVVPKIFQMIHVLFFYFFAGNTIIRILHSVLDTRKTEGCEVRNDVNTLSEQTECVSDIGNREYHEECGEEKNGESSEESSEEDNLKSHEQSAEPIKSTWFKRQLEWMKYCWNLFIKIHLYFFIKLVLVIMLAVICISSGSAIIDFMLNRTFGHLMVDVVIIMTVFVVVRFCVFCHYEKCSYPDDAFPESAHLQIFDIDYVRGCCEIRNLSRDSVSDVTVTWQNRRLNIRMAEKKQKEIASKDGIQENIYATDDKSDGGADTKPPREIVAFDTLQIDYCFMGNYFCHVIMKRPFSKYYTETVYMREKNKQRYLYRIIFRETACEKSEGRNPSIRGR